MAASVRGRRRHRWWGPWLAWIWLAIGARSSWADDTNPTASLGLTRGAGAEACITARDLAQAVEARLGHATFVSAAQAGLFVDARVVRAGRGWHATVVASRASGVRVGVRELETASADCRSLDADLILVVALVIDPLAIERPRPTPPAAREVRYVAVAVPVPVPGWSLDARIATTLLGGVLPSLTPGIELSIAATPPGAWPIELGVIVTRSASADQGGHGADVRLAIGSVAVCPELHAPRRYRLQLCAGGAAGALLVRSHGLDPAGGGDRAAGLLFGRGRGSVRVVGGLHAVIDLGMTVPLARRSLYYTSLDPTTLQVARHDLYDVAAVGWIASLGLGMQIP